MPGLIRGVARTAVVAGTATAVSGRVARRQNQKWSQQEYEQQQQYAAQQQAAQQQQYAAPPAQYAEPAPAPAAGAGMGSVLDQLKQLGELKDAGVLTEAEFEAQKAKLLG
jgi:transcription initiation factor TFIID subunit TAF12